MHDAVALEELAARGRRRCLIFAIASALWRRLRRDRHIVIVGVILGVVPFLDVGGMHGAAVEIKFRAPHADDATCFRSCVCSMAWRFHAIDAVFSP